MCGRFTLTVVGYDTLARSLGIDVDPDVAKLYRPRYNIAPTDRHWVLRSDQGRRELLPAAWGLPNRFSPGGQLINVRSETVGQKPAFRRAFAERRCIVPADGFYEWTGPRGARRPFWFYPKRGGLLFFAGIYERPHHQQGGDEREEPRFAILTAAANDVVARVHDRMPVIIPAEAIATWLGSPGAGPGNAASLLETAPPDLLAARPVSPRVGSVAFDDPGCLREEAPSGTLSLFGDEPTRSSTR
jgi:putative SOS response-associated peptidase YedK